MAKSVGQRLVSVGFLICVCGAFMAGMLFSRTSFMLFQAPSASSSIATSTSSSSSSSGSSSYPTSSSEDVKRGKEGHTSFSLPSTTSAPVPIVERIEVIKKEVEIIDVNLPESKEVETFLKLDKDIEDTIRNCLGRQCFDEKPMIPGSTSRTIDRVGLLAPSNSGGEIVLRIVEEIAKNQLGDAAGTIFVLDTHVPTYGYGKNHGWARIVRLYRSIVPHSISLLNNNSLDLIDLQVKQLMRWHCRLNHVAAHTKMLSVVTDELVEKPYVDIEKILTFIGIKTNRAEIVPVVDKYKAELLATLGIPPRGPRGMKHMTPVSILPKINKAIAEEWRSTNGLTVWPCPSFKDVDQLAADQVVSSGGQLEHLPLNAPILAANCSDPFVKCTVGFDRKGG